MRILSVSLLGFLVLFFTLAQEAWGQRRRSDVKSCSEKVFKPFKKYTVTLSAYSDGDTVQIEYGRRKKHKYKVRFLSIDTPETYYRGEDQGEHAEAAKKALQKLLGDVGDKITLYTDADPCDAMPKSRLLAYVHNKEGKDVNLALLEQGLAINFCVHPTTQRCAAYANAVAKAMKEKKGFFGEKSFMEEYSSQLDGKKFFKLPYDFRSDVNRQGDEADYVADIRVIPFKDRDKIAIPYRIFFLPKQKVKPPFMAPPKAESGE